MIILIIILISVVYKKVIDSKRFRNYIMKVYKANDFSEHLNNYLYQSKRLSLVILY